MQVASRASSSRFAKRFKAYNDLIKTLLEDYYRERAGLFEGPNESKHEIEKHVVDSGASKT